VFVYAENSTEPAKALRARTHIAQLAADGSGAVSTQVIGEYVHVLERKFKRAFTREQAVAAARRIESAFPVLGVDARVTREALRAHARYHLGFWDAQLWATARINGIDEIVTEDAPADEIEGVRYTNPFVSAE
jgi:predicted nucleic acid-binding protein